MAGKERTIPAPPANPETQAFWDAARQSKFLVKRCTACGEAHWYPRAICPFCGVGCRLSVSRIDSLNAE